MEIISTITFDLQPQVAQDNNSVSNTSNTANTMATEMTYPEVEVNNSSCAMQQPDDAESRQSEDRRSPAEDVRSPPQAQRTTGGSVYHTPEVFSSPGPTVNLDGPNVNLDLQKVRSALSELNAVVKEEEEHFFKQLTEAETVNTKLRQQVLVSTDELRDTNLNLEKFLTESQARVDNLSETLVAKDVEIAKLQADNETVTSRLEKQTEYTDELRETNVRLHKSVEAAQLMMSTARAETESKMSNVNDTLVAKDLELAKLQAENKAMSESKEMEMAFMQKLLDNKDVEVAKLQAETETITSRLEKQTESTEELRETNVRLQKSVEAAQFMTSSARAEIESKMSNVNDTLVAKDVELTKLQAEYKVMSESKETEITLMQKLLETQEEEAKKLRAESKTSGESLIAQEAALSHLRAELETLQAAFDAIKTEKDDIEQGHEDAKEKWKRLVITMKSEYDNFRSSFDHLKASKKEMEETYTAEKNALVQEVAKLRSENASLNASIDSMTICKEVSDKQYKESAQTWERNKDELQDANGKFKTEVAELRAEIFNLTEANRELSENLKSNQEVKDENARLSAEVQNLKNTLSEETKANHDLTEGISELETNVQALRTHLDDNEKAKQEVDTENKLLYAETQSLSKANGMLDDHVQHMKAQFNDQVRNTVEPTEKKFAAIMEEFGKVKSEMSALQFEKQNVQLENSELRTRTEGLLEQRDGFKEELKIEVQEHAALKERHQSLTSTHEDLTVTHARLLEQRDTIKEELKAEVQEHAALFDRFQVLIATHEDLTATHTNTVSEYETLKSEMVDLETTKQEVDKDMENLQADHKAQTETFELFKAEHQHLIKEKVGAEERIARLESDSEALSDSLAAATVDLEDTKVKLAAVEEGKTEAEVRLSSTEMQFLEYKAEAENQLMDYKAEAENQLMDYKGEAEKQLMDYKAEAEKEFAEQTEVLEKEFAEQLGEIKNLNQLAEQKEKELAEQKADLENQLAEQKADAENQLAEQKADAEKELAKELGDQKTEADNQIFGLKHQLEAMTAENESSKSALEGTRIVHQDEKHKLEKKVAKLTKAVETKKEALSLGLAKYLKELKAKETAEKEIGELKDTLEERDETIKKYTNDLEGAETKITALEDVIKYKDADNKKAMANLNEKLEDSLNYEVTQREAALQAQIEAENKLAEVEKKTAGELAEMQQKTANVVAEMQMETQTRVADMKKLVAKKDAEVLAAKCQNDNLQSELKSLEESSKSLEETLRDQLNSQEDQIKSQEESLLAELESQGEAHREELSSLSQNLKETEATLKEKSSECDSLQGQLAIAEQGNKKAKEEAAEMKHQISNLNKSVAKKIATITVLESQCETLKNTVDVSATSETDAVKKTDFLHQMITSKEKELLLFKDRCASLQTSLDESEVELAKKIALEKELEETHAKVAETKLLIEKKSTELQTVQERCDKLQVSLMKAESLYVDGVETIRSEAEKKQREALEEERDRVYVLKSMLTTKEAELTALKETCEKLRSSTSDEEGGETKAEAEAKLAEEMKDLLNKVTFLDGMVATKDSELDLLRTRCEGMQSSITKMQDAHEKQMTLIKDEAGKKVTEEYLAKEAELKALNSEIATKQSKLKSLRAGDEFEIILDNGDDQSVVENLRTRINNLEQELDKFKGKSHTLEAVMTATSFDGATEQLKSRCDELQESLDTMTKQYQEECERRKEAEHVFATLNQKPSNLSSSLPESTKAESTKASSRGVFGRRNKPTLEPLDTTASKKPSRWLNLRSRAKKEDLTVRPVIDTRSECEQRPRLSPTRRAASPSRWHSPRSQQYSPRRRTTQDAPVALTSLDKEHILAQMPAHVKSNFYEVGLYRQRLKNSYVPVLCLGPFDVPPGPVRNEWLSKFDGKSKVMSLGVYFLGKVGKDEDVYGTIPWFSFVPYSKAVQRGFDVVPKDITEKIEAGEALTADEKQIRDGMKALKDAASKSKAERTHPFQQHLSLPLSQRNVPQSIVTGSESQDDEVSEMGI